MGSRMYDLWNSSSTRWGYALAGCLALLLVLRIGALYFNGTDLFFDEAQYWAWSEEPDFGYYSKPPMIAWMIRAASETCGLEEYCIRLPSPLLHTMTALGVFGIGARLYDVRVGALAGIIFATLPGVSVSSGIISTDVPLLMFWAVALFAFIALLETKRWWPALLLGFALGFGMNAKYAMAWFGICAAIYLVMTPSRRWILADARMWVALALGTVLIVPNVLWNMEHKFATLSHTADNANWGGDLFHPIKALEFIAAQFGVFGPILFGALVVISWRGFRQRLPESDRLLLTFCLPIIVLITLQALLSRAHANWAAVAYVSASVLVVATMVRDVAWPWLRASFAIHVAFLALVVIGTSVAGNFALFGVDPFARTLGWQEIASATRGELAKARAAGRPFASVISDERPATAELLYYMRDEPTPVYAYRSHPTGKIRDHFELTRPFTAQASEPVLLVSMIGKRSRVKKAFRNVETLSEHSVSAGPTKSRRVTFYSLSGYEGK